MAPRRDKNGDWAFCIAVKPSATKWTVATVINKSPNKSRSDATFHPRILRIGYSYMKSQEVPTFRPNRRSVMKKPITQSHNPYPAAHIPAPGINPFSLVLSDIDTQNNIPPELRTTILLSWPRHRPNQVWPDRDSVCWRRSRHKCFHGTLGRSERLGARIQKREWFLPTHLHTGWKTRFSWSPPNKPRFRLLNLMARSRMISRATIFRVKS